MRVLTRPTKGQLVPSPSRAFGLTHLLLRRQWDRKAGFWDQGGSPGLDRVVKAVLDAARPQPGMTVVDLGCGTGSLCLELARQGLEVIAVDISPVMVERTRDKAALAGLTGITCVVAPMEQFQLPPGSVDLVISNYALHHLHDRAKSTLLCSTARWLRPGGRVVVGDMMFGRGAKARDWQILASKASVLARRGPGGWWRIAKNLARFGLRVGEHPLDMDGWARTLQRAGFEEVTVRPVFAEAGVAAATRPQDPGEEPRL